VSERSELPGPLVATGVLKRFGPRVVLEGQSLRVDPGEAVVLRGPNGSGKSTLIGCICGTVIPDEGSIAIGGHDLHTDPLGARAQLRYLPQEIEVPPGLTGRELLAFFADVHGDAAGLERAAVFTQLDEALDRLATTYSVGMRRLLAFATLLPGKASLWVLDEPFAGVDEHGRARMMQVLDRARGAGVGVLLAAHDRDAPELAAMKARQVDLERAPESPGSSTASRVTAR
jgi:ABC-type multidrug transport system ATPase subunit